jgi:hypothetical protein
MWPYIVTFIAVALFPLALAGYGGHLATLALPEDSAQRRRAKLLVWTLAIAGVILFGVSEIISYHADKKRDSEDATFQHDVLDKLNTIINEPDSSKRKQDATDLKEAIVGTKDQGAKQNRIPPAAPQSSSEPDLTRHLLSREEQENFEAPLLAQTDPKETIILNCPANEENDCAYALQFVSIFREAGFTVDGNMVHRITLQSPYYGVVLGEHTDKDPDPNQPVGTGMWMVLTPTRKSVEKAFVNIRTGTVEVIGSQVPTGSIEIGDYRLDKD